jgi:hypothetical protein
MNLPILSERNQKSDSNRSDAFTSSFAFTKFARNIKQRVFLLLRNKESHELNKNCKILTFYHHQRKEKHGGKYYQIQDNQVNK